MSDIVKDGIINVELMQERTLKIIDQRKKEQESERFTDLANSLNSTLFGDTFYHHHIQKVYGQYMKVSHSSMLSDDAKNVFKYMAAFDGKSDLEIGADQFIEFMDLIVALINDERLGYDKEEYVFINTITGTSNWLDYRRIEQAKNAVWYRQLWAKISSPFLHFFKKN